MKKKKKKWYKSKDVEWMKDVYQGTIAFALKCCKTWENVRGYWLRVADLTFINVKKYSGCELAVKSWNQGLYFIVATSSIIEV